MLTLDFINVGYGDAILIRDTDAAFSMLVDCGDITTGQAPFDSKRTSAADFLRQAGIQTIDLLVLTHLHRDHSGGLTELLKTVTIKEFWTNYLPEERFWGSRVTVDEHFSPGARCLLESLNILLSALQTMHTCGTVIRHINASCATTALTPALKAEIYLEDEALFRRQEEIWHSVLCKVPVCRELDELDQFINNTSIRMRLVYGSAAVELPGDVYAACWEKHQLMPCTIMKLPHHGHRDSISQKLLDMLRPEQAVISVSNTRTDDCPSPAAMELVRSNGCVLHITDAPRCDTAAYPAHSSVHFSIPSSPCER